MRTYEQFRIAREAGTVRCIDEVEFFLDRVRRNAHLNAFITIAEEAELRQQARIADQRFDSGNPRPLEGMIVAIKDNISTRGLRTTCASRILENFIPVYDATAVKRLRDAGAICIGKTNLDEFAMGSSNENSAFGPVKNPHNEDYVPGGSSGGSAVAVAAEMCHVALGSDTGGSVRQPAAFCGIIGLKPTYGRISRYGLVAFASSLDQIGILAHSTADTARVLDIISGHDPQDSTSAPLEPTHSYPLTARKPKRVAILDATALQHCDEEIRASYRAIVQRLEQDQVECVPVEFPASDALVATYYIIATAEASSNLARYDGIRYGVRQAGEDVITASRSAGFGIEVKRRIMLGTYVLSSGYYEAYYRKALRARRFFVEWYNTIFAHSDFFLLPTSPTPPFRLGERLQDPIAMYLADLFTISANLAALPAISIPAGWTSAGLPIGIQLQVPKFQETQLLQYAHWLQQLMHDVNNSEA